MKFKYEPVRVIAWLNSILIAAASIVNQVSTGYDGHSGWVGLALAVVVAVSAELARARVTPVASIEDNRTINL